jgi:hypothetical protein
MTSPSTSTAPEDVPLARVRRVRVLRRVFVVCLTAFLVAGLAGIWGVKSDSVVATGGGYDLQVTYAQFARPGLAVPFQIEVHSAGGFKKDIELATTAKYFDMVDFNNLQPNPSKETMSGDSVVWTFDKPTGDTLRVSLDGRISPGVQDPWAPPATTALLVKGQPVVKVTYRTRVWP